MDDMVITEALESLLPHRRGPDSKADVVTLLVLFFFDPLNWAPPALW
jgi:hypothetical protein